MVTSVSDAGTEAGRGPVAASIVTSPCAEGAGDPWLDSGSVSGLDGERTVVQTLLRLLEETLELDVDITDDTPLLSSGLIDSFDLVVLIGALEDTYGVRIDLMDVDVEALDTPNQILQRVQGAVVRQE